MAALVITAANVLAGEGITKRVVTAGGTITAGMPVYKDAADSDKYKASRANVLATKDCDGIALNGAANGQPLSIATGEGDLNLGATLAVGEAYCVSDAVAGQIVPFGDLGAGDFVEIIGVAETASNLLLGARTAGVAKA
jgi:hypothetical protein